MSNRKKNTPDDIDACEEFVSQTGLGKVRDWGTGMMSMALGSNAGNLWVVRMVDGSLAASYVWEHHERWYANVVLFEGPDGTRTFEVLENLGPYPTMGHASHWSGLKAGQLALKYKRDDESAEDDENDDG